MTGWTGKGEERTEERRKFRGIGSEMMRME